MAESTCTVPLPKLVDLALHSPEMGVVNFNILHNLLHVIIQQLDLSETNVEFRGNHGDVIQNIISTSKGGPVVNLSEYTVSGKGGKKKKSRRKSSDSAGGETEADGGDDDKTIVIVEDADDDGTVPQISVAVPKTAFDAVQQDLDSLKDQIKELSELPGNLGLIDAVRQTVDKNSPVLDMFQILNLIKRADACEEGITKLASMIEDLAREQANVLATAGQRDDGSDEYGDSGRPVSNERLDELEKRIEKLETSDAANLNEIRDELEDLKEKMGESGPAKPKGEDGEQPVQLLELEDKLKELQDQMISLDNNVCGKVDGVQTQITELEKELGALIEKINAGLPGFEGGEANMAELYNKLAALQNDMDTMTETAAKLLEDKEEKQKLIHVLQEELELLKTIKADREDLEDALADKADACIVNRKVSHDQFDTACDDLSRGIEEALTKLTQQEALWQQALDDIQREIGNKLDKMELTPLRDFINNKLKMLQDRLKALAALKKEQEAAGTRSRFLRNVNCISCDKEVIMRKDMDPSILPKPAALPPTRSMGPYLAYELDALRKQQKCAPHSRNLNHFESAVSGKAQKDEDHICNRYCGGSHTTTTPQQRVTRLGHFLTQWGPEMGPTNEGQIRGTDGQMYKARDIPETNGKKSKGGDAEYYPDTKMKTSVMVQGDIVAARKAMKATLSTATSEKGDGEPAEKPAEEGAEKKGSQESAEKKSIDKKTSAEKKGSVEKKPSAEKKGSAEKKASVEKKASADKKASGSVKGSMHSTGSKAEAAPPPEPIPEAASEMEGGDEGDEGEEGGGEGGEE